MIDATIVTTIMVGAAMAYRTCIDYTRTVMITSMTNYRVMTVACSYNYMLGICLLDTGYR
jgi:hypothetical protein